MKRSDRLGQIKTACRLRACRLLLYAVGGGWASFPGRQTVLHRNAFTARSGFKWPLRGLGRNPGQGLERQPKNPGEAALETAEAHTRRGMPLESRTISVLRYSTRVMWGGSCSPEDGWMSRWRSSSKLLTPISTGWRSTVVSYTPARLEANRLSQAQTL